MFDITKQNGPFTCVDILDARQVLIGLEENPGFSCQYCLQSVIYAFHLKDASNCNLLVGAGCVSYFGEETKVTAGNIARLKLGDSAYHEFAIQVKKEKDTRQAELKQKWMEKNKDWSLLHFYMVYNNTIEQTTLDIRNYYYEHRFLTDIYTDTIRLIILDSIKKSAYIDNNKNLFMLCLEADKENKRYECVTQDMNRVVMLYSGNLDIKPGNCVTCNGFVTHYEVVCGIKTSFFDVTELIT